MQLSRCELKCWQWQWLQRTSTPPPRLTRRYCAGLVINQADVSVRWFFTPCRRPERRFRKLRWQTTLHLLTGNLIWKYFIKPLSVSLFQNRVTDVFNFQSIDIVNRTCFIRAQVDNLNFCPLQFATLESTKIIHSVNQMITALKILTEYNFLLAWMSSLLQA